MRTDFVCQPTCRPTAPPLPLPLSCSGPRPLPPRPVLANGPKDLLLHNQIPEDKTSQENCQRSLTFNALLLAGRWRRWWRWWELVGVALVGQTMDQKLAKSWHTRDTFHTQQDLALFPLGGSILLSNF